MTTVPAHAHAFDPDGIADDTTCSAHPGCTLTYAQLKRGQRTGHVTDIFEDTRGLNRR